MPRRGNVPKREVLPDPLYNSILVTKLVNSIMLDGKKGVAQKVVYGAFDIIKEKTGNEPLEVFTAAMEILFFICKNRITGKQSFRTCLRLPGREALDPPASQKLLTRRLRKLLPSLPPVHAGER